MKTIIKPLLLIILASFILWLLVSFIPVLPFRYIVGFAAFFCWTYFIIKKVNTKVPAHYILLGVLLGTVLFELPYSLTHLPWQLIGLAALGTYLLGSVGGYIVYVGKKPVKIITVILSIAYCLLYYFVIHPQIFHCLLGEAGNAE